jgi:ssDNA-binding Zn-finger/Zn-ribbon topoisomerase 1
MKRIELSSRFILEKCPQCLASTLNGEPDWRTAAKKRISCSECGEAMDRIESRDDLTHITYEECPKCRASNSSYIARITPLGNTLDKLKPGQKMRMQAEEYPYKTSVQSYIYSFFRYRKSNKKFKVKFHDRETDYTISRIK